MMPSTISFAPTPQLHMGVGKITGLPALVKPFGTRLALITGKRSFTTSTHGPSLWNNLHSSHIEVKQWTIDKEPTPFMVDSAVTTLSDFSPHVVVAIGGGSVLDAGKAISAMLPLHEPVKDYLEGVGTKNHPGIKIPFIAVPTTAGTGSEATKNAVISEVGENGFKKSLRHNKFVPDLAVLDPALTLGCPPETTAASGMDAFTQLLESYLSTAANPLTDAFAIEGLTRVADSLLPAYHTGDNIEARANMLLAAYLSGVTLANAGLGVVHGFASSVGGYFDIAHGVICSSLMAASNIVTVRKLREQGNHATALAKYAKVGMIFSKALSKSQEYYIDSLLALMSDWTTQMKIPKLSQYGVSSADFEKIVQVTDCKNNPVKLAKEELLEVLERASK